MTTPATGPGGATERALGSLCADDVGKRVTILDQDVEDRPWRTGRLVRIDHDLAWSGAADLVTFVGFASDADLAANPGVLLQRHGVRLPSSTRCVVSEWTAPEGPVVPESA